MNTANINATIEKIFTSAGVSTSLLMIVFLLLYIASVVAKKYDQK